METIRIDRSQAETLIRFLDKCREAERFFEVCQAPSYRRFVSNAQADPALHAAYAALREGLSAERAEQRPERKKPSAEKPKAQAERMPGSARAAQPEQSEQKQEEQG